MHVILEVEAAEWLVLFGLETMILLSSYKKYCVNFCLFSYIALHGAVWRLDSENMER